MSQDAKTILIVLLLFGMGVGSVILAESFIGSWAANIFAISWIVVWTIYFIRDFKRSKQE